MQTLDLGVDTTIAAPPNPMSAADAGTPKYNDSLWGTYGLPTMLLSGAVAGLGDIMAANNQSQALQSQAKLNRFQADENAKRGAMGVAQIQQETAAQLGQSGSHAQAIIGAERASFANQGVNVNAGVPLAEQVSTGKISAVDAMTIRNNAALKAWGVSTSAGQVSGQQEMEATAEDSEAKQSLALGGAKAANALITQIDTYESMRTRGW